VHFSISIVPDFNHTILIGKFRIIIQIATKLITGLLTPYPVKFCTSSYNEVLLI
jgi:hypothetical protein